MNFPQLSYFINEVSNTLATSLRREILAPQAIVVSILVLYRVNLAVFHNTLRTLGANYREWSEREACELFEQCEYK